MPVDSNTILLGGGMAIAGLVWLLRLESRVDVTDARYLDIIARLTRIEHAQDRGRND